MFSSIRFPVRDRSQVGEARRLAAAWAGSLGCSKDEQGRIALIISELAANLALHTVDGGSLVLQTLEADDAMVIEILSLDQGPGSANFGANLQDGFSTSGTAGTGLGAVKRASDLFDVQSQSQIGTALLSQMRFGAAAKGVDQSFGMVNIPIKGEEICGDTVGYLKLGSGVTRVMVADGLGHGPMAAEASRTALEVFRRNPTLGLAPLLEEMHGAMRATRGAAVAVAEVDAGRQVVRYAGVGNIAGYIVGPGDLSSHMVSMNGTLGMIHPRIQEFTYPWREDAILVMTSDGLKNHWRLDRYPGITSRHPSVIAGVLFRDHCREKDDATAAVLKYR